MIARLASVLVMLAIAAGPTAASAHAAGISASQEHAIHGGEMMHASVGSVPSCDGDRQCAPTDTGACELLCTGLSALPALPDAESGKGHVPLRHDPPAEAARVGRASDLNEHPPRIDLI